MGKKVFSLCMALALCLVLLPAAALAADGATVYVGSVALTGSKEKPAYAKTDDSGNVSQDGATADDYNIKWDGETLTLQNATIKEAKEYSNKTNEKIAIYLASGNMNLVLVGENTVDALGEGSAASCGINLGGGSPHHQRRGKCLFVGPCWTDDERQQLRHLRQRRDHHGKRHRYRHGRIRVRGQLRHLRQWCCHHRGMAP